MENGRGRKRIWKNLIIIRGLPGVGKKNKARKLLYEFGSGGMYSASDYHAMFNWNKDYFSQNHMWNRRDVFRAMKEDVDPIIVYNLHYRLQDMWPFVAMGMRRGDYQISIIELPENYVSINQLYSNCLGKIRKQMFRNWVDFWEEADDIWDVYHDSYSIYRWQNSREEWNF
ncbi:NEDD4-binding protein 2-like 1 [Salvelinus fontinalis]|uniref:NEDD4-binding protein 2-like 1 n=1 Tax=Salvelinus fontinalis TaxID=8038 RepID=UPI002484FB54|nr:NEDD4-binding protein 2-like 1 [Salvelinus fontinalis]